MTAMDSLPIAGTLIAPKSRPPCALCRRLVNPGGRLLYPGTVTCCSPECETHKVADLTRIFTTPYGRALDLYTLRSFGRCLDGPSILVSKESIRARKEDLALAMIWLLDWQDAFNEWISTHRPTAAAEGRCPLLPPRRLDEVVRVRLRGSWISIDPTEGLPADIRKQIRSTTEEEVPF